MLGKEVGRDSTFTRVSNGFDDVSNLRVTFLKTAGSWHFGQLNVRFEFQR